MMITFKLEASKLRIIDTHTHIYPDSIANKAAQSVRAFYELSGVSLDGTVATLLHQGDRAGIDKFVVLPVALTPNRTRHINDYILSQVALPAMFTSAHTLTDWSVTLLSEEVTSNHK